MRGSIEVVIAKDMMSATACISEAGEQEITEELIMDVLHQNGITAGIDKKAVTELAKENTYYAHHTVAVGKAPTNGSDGYYEFYFNPESQNTKPAIREDGTVDYSVQRQIVPENTLIAKYFKSVPGAFGYSVYSSMIAPIPVKDAPGLVCKNVEKREDEYYSTIAGEIEYDDFHIEIANKLTIKGDAGYGTGNIVYAGDVQIIGDVKNDVHVISEGNVVIDGVVEGAHIEATGDIVVMRGVHGKGRATLKAGGSIIANFITDATAEAGKEILVDYLMNSDTFAGRKICATGRNGNIIGGHTTSCHRIEADNFSNDVGIKTVLSIVSSDGTAVSDAPTIIAHRHFYEGSIVKMGDQEHVVSSNNASGEFHLLGSSLRKYDIGDFKVSQRTKDKAVVEEKPIVLLVDDESLILKTFYQYLKKKYKVAAANSAKEAFKFMDRIKPDLILLDYQMPEMNGGQMLEFMRKDQNSPYYDIPVYFVTAVVDKNIILKCLSLYPQGYLIKPLGEFELVDVVDKFFASKKK